MEISLPFHSLLGAGLEYLNRSVALISSALKLFANSVIKLFAKLHREISSQILHNNFPIATTNDPGRTSAIASVTASLVFSRLFLSELEAYFTCGKSLPNFLRNFPPFWQFPQLLPFRCVSTRTSWAMSFIILLLWLQSAQAPIASVARKSTGQVAKARCNKIPLTSSVRSRVKLSQNLFSHAQQAPSLSPAYFLSRQQRQTLPTPHPAHPMIYALHTHAPHTHTQTHTQQTQACDTHTHTQTHVLR